VPEPSMVRDRERNVREVIPYRTLGGAKRALDNGGRFFNLFAKADDGL